MTDITVSREDITTVLTVFTHQEVKRKLFSLTNPHDPNCELCAARRRLLEAVILEQR